MRTLAPHAPQAHWLPRGDCGAGGLVERVLRARGLAGAEHDFLNPSLTQLHDPSLMHGVDRASERLLAALTRGQRVVIYGDYDADGISASAILYHTLKHIAPAADVRTYVPHRMEEGYGLNSEAIAQLASDGAQVIVSVDCGVTALEPARAARQRGVDLIITDHHNLPEGELPDAYAIVHPRLGSYPDADLSGSAVAFKLAWRLATLACGSSRVDAGTRALLLELIALAALGVIADVVPLRGENRVIARFGLSSLRQSRVEGLRALIAASALDGEKIKASDVGFRLAPRLNACGRLGHAREAVELLTTATGERARTIAAELTALNDQRRAIEKTITEHATQLAREHGMDDPSVRAIVLAHEDWHQGVVGIACSRLVGLFHKPVILMHKGAELCHGSGRSVEGFSLHAALRACSPLLAGFGGHDMAAGLRVGVDRLGEFTRAFLEHASCSLGEPRRLLSYDAEASLGELDYACVRSLESLAPFGRDNPPVRLLLRGVRTLSRPRLMGQGNAHASFALSDPHCALRVVAWGWGHTLADFPPGSPLDVLITPTLSTWNGQTNVEAELVDLRPSG